MAKSFKFDTTRERSELMKKIKSQDIKPEILFRKKLYEQGYRYRINYSKLPGKPDIVIKKYKLVIFIDGEFWHGYQWNTKKKKIKANRAYWIPKIERTIKRDKENNTKLEKLGYKVFRFWEHEIKKDFDRCLNEVIHYTKEINQNNVYLL